MYAAAVLEAVRLDVMLLTLAWVRPSHHRFPKTVALRQARIAWRDPPPTCMPALVLQRPASKTLIWVKADND